MDLFLGRASDGRGDEVGVGLGLMSGVDGGGGTGEGGEGRVLMAFSKVVSRPAEVRSNTFGGRNNCLQQNGCDRELPAQRSWFYNPEEPSGGSKADSHSAMRDCVLGGETCQLKQCESLVKRQWGQTQSVCSLSIGGLGVLRASEWVAMVWSKVS